MSAASMKGRGARAAAAIERAIMSVLGGTGGPMSGNTEALARIYLDDLVAQFRNLKQQAERALAQVGDGQLTATLDAESNSIATLMQHMAGNLRSRWTDFLTTDGEKPDRDRDSEFEAGGLDPARARAELLARWEEGWQRLFATLGSLTAGDLLRTVHLRAEPQSVPQAIHRQLTHQAYHVGQLVLLAKHFAGDRWQTLSVAKGKSRERNAEMFARLRPG
jgi:uncharacterized damage-inducible protein DinB